jgi:hypothetical protein
VFAPGTLEAMKWGALVLMTLDHVDAFVYGRSLLWAGALGRLVFPVFAVVLAINLARPRALERGVYRRALVRLVVFAALAEPAHALLASHRWGWWPLNVLATFAVFVGCAWLIERRRWELAAALFLAGGALVEYAWPGVGLCLAVWWLYRSPWILPAIAVGFSWASLELANGNSLALWAVPLLVLVSRLQLDVPRLRWVFYAYYPAHLVAFWLLLRAW